MRLEDDGIRNMTWVQGFPLSNITGYVYLGHTLRW